jgi:hypothetical protein
MAYMYFEDVLDQVNQLAEQYIKTLEYVRADQCGLDYRAGYVYVGREADDVVAVESTGRRALEYYGGFEYVVSECVTTIGNYTFYRGSERVTDCVDAFAESEESEEIG